MARATAAAAGGLLACAVLLLFAGQSAATTTFLFPFIGTFPKIFPVGYLAAADSDDLQQAELPAEHGR
jgi:hypothetical protein